MAAKLHDRDARRSDDTGLNSLRDRLSAEIIRALDGMGGLDAEPTDAELARLRTMRLDPATPDRLMTILTSLGREPNVKLSVAARDERPANRAAA